MYNLSMKNLIVLLLSLVITNTALAKLTGSQQSFNHAFEERMKLDGNDGEELDIEIGKMIKTHPTNFLKALKKYREKTVRLDSILMNLGDEYVDQEEKTKLEWKARATVFEKFRVKSSDKSLKALATECIEILKRQ